MKSAATERVGARELVVVGVSHHTTPVEVRERLAAACEDAASFLRDMTGLHGVQEAVLLSTCNRVEVVACCSPEPASADALASRMAEAGGISSGATAGLVFTMRGREAVRHVFRVASSLDSMVVGEPQILGQLKQQFDLSAACDAAGPVLFRVFHKSFSVAKRVRTETGVASKSVSVAATAVDLATSIFESLEGRTVMLLGAGETGEIAARHFQAAGVGQVIVVNRTFEAAVDLVGQRCCRVINRRIRLRAADGDCVIDIGKRPHDFDTAPPPVVDELHRDGAAAVEIRSIRAELVLDDSG